MKSKLEKLLEDGGDVSSLIDTTRVRMVDIAMEQIKKKGWKIERLNVPFEDLLADSSPEIYNVYVNAEGNLAYVIHKELRIKSRYELPWLTRGMTRDFVMTTWENFIRNLYKIR